MRRYAKRIGADFAVLDKSLRIPAHFAKFDLFTQLAKTDVDHVVYVDADVYIKEHAPPVTAIYSNAAFSEVPHPRTEWLNRSIQWIRENLVPDWPSDLYFNTGVIVLSGEKLQQLATLVSNASPVPGLFFEQDQLNVLMREAGFPQQKLSQRWNQFCGRYWRSPTKLQEAYFLHGNGLGVGTQKFTRFRDVIKGVT